MALSDSQLTTLAAHIRANTDPLVISALSAGSTGEIADLYNRDSTTTAWMSSVPKQAIVEDMAVKRFDTLSAGKRDSFTLLTSLNSIDFTKGKIRGGFADVWELVNSQSETVLLAGQELATIAEDLYGGQTRSTTAKRSSGAGGNLVVSALKRIWEGNLGSRDVSKALNDNPV